MWCVDDRWCDIRLLNRKRLSIRPLSAGLSQLELLAVVTILAVLATIVVSGFSGADVESRTQACYVNKGDIEIQAALWFRDHGRWPASDLSDISLDPDYLPDGLPRCLVDGSAYKLDSTTHRVIGHTH